MMSGLISFLFSNFSILMFILLFLLVVVSAFALMALDPR